MEEWIVGSNADVVQSFLQFLSISEMRELKYANQSINDSFQKLDLYWRTILLHSWWWEKLMLTYPGEIDLWMETMNYQTYNEWKELYEMIKSEINKYVYVQLLPQLHPDYPFVKVFGDHIYNITKNWEGFCNGVTQKVELNGKDVSQKDYEKIAIQSIRSHGFVKEKRTTRVKCRAFKRSHDTLEEYFVRNLYRLKQNRAAPVEQAFC